MKVKFIETDLNTYIELEGVMLGYFTRRYNKELKCVFISEQTIKFDELVQICDKMGELNGT